MKIPHPQSQALKKLREVRDQLQLRLTWDLIWKSAPGWTVAGMALVLLQGVLPLAALYLVKLVVDAVASGMEGSSPGVDFHHVGLLIAVTAAVTLLANVCGSLSAFIREAQSQAVSDHVYNVVHAKAVELDLEDYENPEYHDLIHLVIGHSISRPPMIVQNALTVVQNGISMGAVLVLLASFHWAVPLALIAAALPGALLRLRHAMLHYEWNRSRSSTERRAIYFHLILTGLDHAKELRLFGLGPVFRKRFEKLQDQLRREKLHMAARRTAGELVTQAGATLALFGSYAFIAYRTVLGAVTIGDLVMYYEAFRRGQGFLREILRGTVSFYESNLFLSNLSRYLAFGRKVQEPRDPAPVPVPMREGMALEDVSFAYPGSSRRVLRDISMTIKPGETVALVGENGAGKTTLIKLLCRLYDPSSGRIRMDGRDLKDFSTADLRRQFSVVFQDFCCYNLTARENIWVGNAELPPDGPDVAAAARRAGADEAICGLERGYESLLGRHFDKGEELSAGQWQKVALARAFVRDAQIMVLDEPTSSMDPKSEYEVFQKFRELAQGRTTILISHRLSTVRMADRIYVLQGGRIVESGSHGELIRCCGTYTDLFNRQASGYR